MSTFSDLGVQLDGYIAVVAHTIVVTDGSDEVKDKKGDLFLAAYTAVQTVTKMLVPGTKVHNFSKLLVTFL